LGFVSEDRGLRGSLAIAAMVGGRVARVSVARMSAPERGNLARVTTTERSVGAPCVATEYSSKIERPEHTPCPFKIALKDQHSIPLYVRHARSQASDIIRGTHRLDALRLKLGEKRTNFDRSGN